MNNDFYKAETAQAVLNNPDRFNDVLNRRLEKLAREKWGISETDPKIAEIQNAAHISILGRTGLTLARMRNKSSFEDHRSYFESLTAQNFTPKLYGNVIKPNTEQYGQAVKFLKDFAYHVGSTILGEQAQKQKIALEVNKDPAWIHNGLMPTDNGIDGVEVIESELPHHEIDWGAETVPALLPLDEKAKLKDEKDTIIKIINGSSPFELKQYLQNTLLPRSAEVIAELGERREKYSAQTAFQLREGALIDFQSALEDSIQQALRKIETPVVEAENDIQPFPTLITNDEVAAKPTEAIVQTNARKQVFEKAKAKLKTMEANLEDFIQKSSADALIKLYQSELKPRLVTLHKEIASLKASGTQPDLLDIKEKHFEVLKTGATNLYAKINNEKDKERNLAPAVKAPEPIVTKRPANDFDFIPTLTDVVKLSPAGVAKAAFVGSTQQDQSFAKFIPKAATPVALVTAPEPIAQEDTRRRPIPTDTSNATTVKFKMMGAEGPKETKEPKKKSSLWNALKMTATAATGLALAAGSFFVVFAIGLDMRQSQKTEDAMAKASASAQAEFNNKAQQGYAAPTATQPATIIVSAPANDMSAKASKPPIERSLAEEEALKTAKIVKTEAPKAKTTYHSTAKTSFASAANDDQVTYSNAIIAKPFDIASTRVGLDTLNRACEYIKAQGATVENGICPQ